MTRIVTVNAADATAMQAWGARLGACLAPAAIIYLQGDLGAGKTTLVGGVLRACGHVGAAKSPTYTLVEPYTLGVLGAPGTLSELQLYHFDLYRLRDPEELEFLGIRDYVAAGATLLIEWPERGAALLPPADIAVAIAHRNNARALTFSAHTAAGERMLRCIFE